MAIRGLGKYRFGNAWENELLDDSPKALAPPPIVRKTASTLRKGEITSRPKENMHRYDCVQKRNMTFSHYMTWEGCLKQFRRTKRHFDSHKTYNGTRIGSCAVCSLDGHTSSSRSITLSLLVSGSVE